MHGDSLQATEGMMLINAKPTASERAMAHLAHKKSDGVVSVDRSLDSVATFVLIVVTRI
jgi:hypothetical protein